jgi:hypothetical protein
VAAPVDHSQERIDTKVQRWIQTSIVERAITEVHARFEHILCKSIDVKRTNDACQALAMVTTSKDDDSNSLTYLATRPDPSAPGGIFEFLLTLRLGDKVRALN